MKTLVVYYSLEGNTKLIAQTLKEELNCDIVELKPEKEYPDKGFKKFFWGGKSVLFKEKPTLLNEEIKINNYDNIILGTPVWAGTYAAPFNTFIKQYKINNKNIALFACHGGGGANKCFNNYKKEFSNNNFIGEIDFIDPLLKDTEENIQKSIKWIKSLNI